MKGSATWRIAALLLPCLCLAGCAPSGTSAERHARHFAYAAGDNFDPSFVINKAESGRMMIPFFEQFWQMGRKDRADGLSRAQADERVKYLNSDEFIDSLKGETHFAGKRYKSDDGRALKWRKVMREAATGSYQDGYNGVQ